MKRKLLILTLIGLLIAPSFTVFSQTRDSNTVTIDQTVAVLLAKNKESRELIEKQKIRIADLETEISLEKENSGSVSKSYETAKTEIISLKQSNEALSRAVSLNEQTIALLQADNAKQKEKAKKANKEKWKARGVAALMIVLEVVRVVH